MNIFDDVPVEPDTRILHSMCSYMNDIPFRLESWSWDGIHGKTVIVHKDHCPSNLIDEESLKTLFGIEGSTTFREKEQYCYLNYDFSI